MRECGRELSCVSRQRGDMLARWILWSVCITKDRLLTIPGFKSNSSFDIESTGVHCLHALSCNRLRLPCRAEHHLTTDTRKSGQSRSVWCIHQIFSLVQTCSFEIDYVYNISTNPHSLPHHVEGSRCKWKGEPRRRPFQPAAEIHLPTRRVCDSGEQKGKEEGNRRDWKGQSKGKDDSRKEGRMYRFGRVLCLCA